MDFERGGPSQPTRYGGAGERKNFVALAGAVTGIDEDVAPAQRWLRFFYGGHNGEVERICGENRRRCGRRVRRA